MSAINKFTPLVGLVPFLLAACVSVSVGPKAPEKAKAVKYSSPRSPFAELEVKELDRAWKSKTTGNTISYKTSCEEASDPSLAYMHKSLLEGIDALKIEKNETISFNNREAIHSLVSGKLDGVETRIELMVFKKNNCAYTITLVGLPGRFEGDQPIFDSFLKGFEAP